MLVDIISRQYLDHAANKHDQYHRRKVSNKDTQVIFFLLLELVAIIVNLLELTPPKVLQWVHKTTHMLFSDSWTRVFL